MSFLKAHRKTLPKQLNVAKNKLTTMRQSNVSSRISGKPYVMSRELCPFLYKTCVVISFNYYFFIAISSVSITLRQVCLLLSLIVLCVFLAAFYTNHYVESSVPVEKKY